MIIFHLSTPFHIQRKRGGPPLKDSEIAEILMDQNEHYRRLYEEHKKLDHLLEEIDKKKFLTSEEEIERKKIQKQKLLKKDSMAGLMREFKKSQK
jgi:uncharacterized protein YdcH (DUF465 family)